LIDTVVVYDVPGDETSLEDANEHEYVYRVTDQRVAPPDNVEVMNAVEGKSLVTLQTCTPRTSPSASWCREN
jgi:LPXTG-site transpeptidase (sortase) family protein